MLATPAKAMIKIDNLPGFIAIVGNSGDVYIVNVYPMRILSHLMLEFTGIGKIRYLAKTHTLLICDANGKLIVCVDQNKSQNQQLTIGKDATQNQWLNYLNKNSGSIQVKFQESARMGGKETFEVRRL